MNTEFKTGQLVRLIEPDGEIERAFIFEVIDDSDQDCLLCVAINSTLKMPPVEEFHHNNIELIP